MSALEGCCACGHVRLKLQSKPMFVHCRHCRERQRQTGSASYCSSRDLWPAESLTRRKALFG